MSTHASLADRARRSKGYASLSLAESDIEVRRNFTRDTIYRCIYPALRVEARERAKGGAKRAECEEDGRMVGQEAGAESGTVDLLKM